MNKVQDDLKWDTFNDQAVVVNDRVVNEIGEGWDLLGDKAFEFQKAIPGKRAAAKGNQYLELDADENGPRKHWSESSDDSRQMIKGRKEESSLTIGQTITTEAGEYYHLRFARKARPGAGKKDNKLGVQVFDIANPNSPTELLNKSLTLKNKKNWKYEDYIFQATSSSTQIIFQDQGKQNTKGAFLDDVSVKQVSLLLLKSISCKRCKMGILITAG